MGRFDAARRLLGGIRRGVDQFMQELAQDLQTPRPVADAPPSPVNEARRERIMLAFQEDFQDRARVLVDRVTSGSLTVPQWRAQMALEIRNLHFSAAVAGAGGFGNLSADDLARVEQVTQEQLIYLNRWAQQLAGYSVDDLLNEKDYMQVRAAMYGGASNASYSKALIKAAGVPDLPFYPAENTECRNNCKCSWDIRPLETQGEFDCYWRRSPVDSCKTCVYRERVASPLEVRQGVIILPEMNGSQNATRSAQALGKRALLTLAYEKVMSHG